MNVKYEIELFSIVYYVCVSFIHIDSFQNMLHAKYNACAIMKH